MMVNLENNEKESLENIYYDMTDEQKNVLY